MDNERQELMDDAVELGLEFPSNIPTGKLRKMVRDALTAGGGSESSVEISESEQIQPVEVIAQKEDVAANPASFSVVNRSAQHYSIVGIDFEPNETVTLTESQLANERLMAKINHMMRLKVFFRVAG